MATVNLFISSSKTQVVKLINNKRIDNNDIIIYSIYLPGFMHLTSDLYKFLNLKEHNRVERFYRDIDKQRFIIYRSVFKFILAAHTQLDVRTIEFDYLLNKKPYLASHPKLYFNISHSVDYAIIAISNNKIGVDIEHISKDNNYTNLMPNIFAKQETSIVQNAVNKKHAFYTFWTRKEAFVKGLGKGIDDDFIEIPCIDGQHHINIDIIKKTTNWQVSSFDLDNQYAGALAFENASIHHKNLIRIKIPNSLKDILGMIQPRNN